MVLEAVVVILDNSEYSRNGDLNPSRWDSQLEAINLLSNVVVQSNMESGIGLILAGGKQVRLLMTPTNDSNVILGQCDKIKQQGLFHFSVAIQQASLALKHRINKKQAMRIVAFVASPIDEEEAVLESLAKRIKKNNIAVDIINFGEQNELHLKKLDLFFKTVQKGNNSQLVNLQPGSNIYDLLFSAFSSAGGQANFQEEGHQQQQHQNQVVNQFLEYGGIDPNTDPELAMAMKLSLDEAKNQPAEPEQQQQQQQQQPIQEEKFEGIEEEDDEDEALLKKAKELSEDQPNPNAEKKEKQKEQENPFKDPDFLKELIKDADEEEIQSLIKKKDDEKE